MAITVALGMSVARITEFFFDRLLGKSEQVTNLVVQLSRLADNIGFNFDFQIRARAA